MRRAALVALAVLAACGDAGREDPLERMLEVPRYDAYEAGPGFPDGRVLQRPPEGTVPRDRIVGNPLLARGEAGGAPAEAIPLPVTPQLLELGRRKFGIYCAACHGAGGRGGSMVAANMQPPLPPSLVSGHGAEHPPGHYFHVITEGTGRMPSYAAELPVVERWAVAAYLTRVLQRPHPLDPAERRDSLRAAALRERFPEAAEPEHRHRHRHGTMEHEHAHRHDPGGGEGHGHAH